MHHSYSWLRTERFDNETHSYVIIIGGVSYGARGAKPPPQILQRNDVKYGQYML